MIKKTKLILSFLSLFIVFAYTGFAPPASAGCAIDCIGNTTGSLTGAPVKCEYDIDVWTSSNKICTVPALDSAIAIFSTVNPCVNSDTNAVPAPNTQACKHDACPDFNYLNGSACQIISSDGALCGNEYKSNGKWDQSEKKCVMCSGKKEGIICGDSSGIYESTGTCNGANSTTFETACDGTVAGACDDKNEGDACNPPAGGTCDASGQCVAALCTNNCVIGQFQCSGTQLQKCADPGTGCGDWTNDTTAANETGKCSDNIDNDCDGQTDAADSDCAATCSITFTNTRNGMYAIRSSYNQMGIAVVPENIASASDAEILSPSSSQRYDWLTDKGSCAGPGPGFKYPAYTLVVGDQTGTWTAQLSDGGGLCASGCTATATVKVVECFENGDCAAGDNCNASGTCVASGGGTNCTSTMCGAANVTPCICGGTTLNGANVWCGYTPLCNPGQGFATQAACQAACTGGGGCVPNGCGGGCPAGCTGADDPDCPGSCLDATCPTDTDCGGSSGNCDPTKDFFCNPLRGTIDNVVEGGQKLMGYVLGLIGSIALLFIVIAGMMYMTSAGNEEKIATSKRILTGAITGISVALIAYGLLEVIIVILNM